MGVVIMEHDVVVHVGDVRVVLGGLPAGSVQCIVTSPPYYGLRDYGVDGQIGLEASPAEYVAELVGVFREARRVLASDGVLWLNLGDSYARGNTGQGNAGPSSGRQGGTRPSFRQDGASCAPVRRLGGMEQKNLLGVPWRVAFGLQDDGWILRNAVIWNKPNAMPESVADRLSCRYEHVFLFSKSRRYLFDLDPIREALACPDAADGSRVFGGSNKASGLTTGSAARRTGNRYGAPRPGANREQGDDHDVADLRGRNPGDVWTIPTSPFPGAHFACMPPELARRCILTGTPNSGPVLDPFVGSGTTLMVARRLGRPSVGIDLNPANVDIIRGRIGQSTLQFGDVAGFDVGGGLVCGG